MKIPLLNLKYGSGGSVVADVLNALGIEYIFTIAGSQTLPVMHEFSKIVGKKLIVSRSERNSVFMAEGYGKALNFPAVSLSTLGPGVANELPALWSAKENKAPLISLSPFHPPWKRGRLSEVFQGLNHPEFLRGAVKETYLIDELRDVHNIIESAFRRCLEEPKGPVHIDISFPILFQPHFYFDFPKKHEHKVKSQKRKVYIIYENVEFVGRFDFEQDILPSPENAEAEMLRLSPGDSSGVLPFSVGVRFAVMGENDVFVFLSSDNLLKNLDSIYVSISNGVSPVIISDKERPFIRRIADIFEIEYQNKFSKNLLRVKANVLNIIIID